MAEQAPTPELKDMSKMPMTKVIVHAPAGVHTGSTEKCWAKLNEYIQLIPYEVEVDVPEDMVVLLEQAWVNVERLAAQPKVAQPQAAQTHAAPAAPKHEESRQEHEYAGKKN